MVMEIVIVYTAVACVIGSMVPPVPYDHCSNYIIAAAASVNICEVDLYNIQEEFGTIFPHRTASALTYSYISLAGVHGSLEVITQHLH